MKKVFCPGIIVGFWLLMMTGNAFSASTSLQTVDELLTRGEQKQALEELKLLIEEDNPEAQERLGDLYISGRGVRSNFSMAWTWYKRSALQGHAPAQYKTGFLYEHGVGVGRYVDKAVEWYEFAAKQGYFAAQIRLADLRAASGKMHRGDTLDVLKTAATRGDQRALKELERLVEFGYQPARTLVDQLPIEIRYGPSVRAPVFKSKADLGIAAFLAGDYVSAVAILRPLADENDAGGTFGMALIHQTGPDIPPDIKKAEELYLSAAKNGSVEAMIGLGLLYWNSMAPPHDRYLVEKWLNLAASKGASRAKQILDLIHYDYPGPEVLRTHRLKINLAHLNGPARDGVQAYLEKDFVKAIKLLKPLADRGDRDGKFGLGLIYNDGVPTLSDTSKALQLYRASATGGYAGAQVNLANMYMKSIGVGKNLSEAMRWYQMAARQGDAVAQTVLGFAYLSGVGQAPNPARASQMFELARQQENGDAMNAVALLDLGAQIAEVNQGDNTALDISAHTAYLTGATRDGIPLHLPGTFDIRQHSGAFDLIVAAAELGNAAAQYNAARLHLLDDPTADNLIRAYKWLTLAHHNGYQAAATARTEILKQLSPLQRIEAEWLTADALKPRIAAPSYEIAEAISGSPEELWEIGQKYRYGKGVEKSYKEALKWFRSAAQKGHAVAQRDLGTIYRRGLGVKKNQEEAVKWFRLSANQGYAKAQRDLGIAHQFGRGAPKDAIEAVRWYRKAAEQGEKKAQTNLAFMYKTGNGTAKNPEEAVKWYLKAAEQGSSTAQKNLGVLYQFGKGVEKNEAEAVIWYRKAAEQGNLKAQENLGFMYKNGLGVGVDYGEAAKWYFVAAKKGSARAQNILGLMYQSGSGVPQDFGRAITWYIKALNQRYTKTYASIDSLMKEDEDSDQTLFYRELLAIIQKRADQGEIKAQNTMGLFYRYGKGVDRDRAAAEQWFKKAIKLGSGEAKKNLAEMLLDQS